MKQKPHRKAASDGDIGYWLAGTFARRNANRPRLRHRNEPHDPDARRREARGVDLQTVKLKGKAPAVLELTQYEIDGGRPGRDLCTRQARLRVRAGLGARPWPVGRRKERQPRLAGRARRIRRGGVDRGAALERRQVVMYGASFVGMTQWRTAAQHPPHLAGIAPYVPIYPGWDVPNTNGIPQAWSA